MTNPSPSFARAILLKVAFHPEPLRRCQAAMVYRALAGGDFTADEVLTRELTGEDPKIAGITVASLASLGLLCRTGRCKSPSESRNGAWVNRWALADGKRGTAQTWLTRNRFPQPTADAMQGELAI